MSTPKFIQGPYTFVGAGLDTPKPMGPRAVYEVPAGKSAKLIYVRAGNSSDELVTLLLTKNGRPLRYFPLGAKVSMHVSLAVTEEIVSESELEVLLAAPEGVEGTVVIDFGFMVTD